MPIYEYLCAACGHRSEELQKMGARPLKSCPECGGKYEKQISAPSFQFKGSGWYVTDYAKKGADKHGKSDDAGSASPTSESKGDSKGEGKSDSKSDTGSDSTRSESKSKSDAKKESKSGGGNKESSGGSTKAGAG
jgi:putative FmdB family regulatory protein